MRGKTWGRWFLAIMVNFGLFGLVAATHANVVDDPYITSVDVTSQSSAELGAQNVTYAMTVVTSSTIEAEYGIDFTINPVDCREDWESCQMNLENGAAVTFGTIDGTMEIYGKESGRFINSADIPAGTYTMRFVGVTNPSVVTGHRFYLSTPQSDKSAYENTNTWVATHSDPVIIGTPFMTGTVTDPDGNPLNTWIEIHDENWTIWGGANSDEWGFYVAANAGFNSGDTVMINVHPDTSLGFYAEQVEVTYNGTTLNQNLSVLRTTKTLSGRVTYADTGDPVTTAQVNVNAPGVWFGDEVDENGEYSITMGGGEFDVCVNSKWDQETNRNMEVDWYIQNNCQQHVSFTKDTSDEEETVNFEVSRTDAVIKGKFKNPDDTFPANGGWVSFWNEKQWFGGDVSSEDGKFRVAVVGGTTDSTITTLRQLAVGSTNYQVQFQPNSPDEHTYWEETKITVSAGETLDLGTITLKERDVIYTGTIVDADGNPVQDVQLNAWQEGGGWAGQNTDENGEAILYLYAGEWNIGPWVGDNDNYVYTKPHERIKLSSGDRKSGTFELSSTTLTVNVEVRDANDAVVAANGWANCWEPMPNGTGFGGDVRNGVGSFGAIGGEYRCNLWMQDQNYQSNAELEVTFVDGEDASLSFTIVERTASITVYVKDQDNNLVEGVRGRVNANSATAGWADVTLEDGVGYLRVAPGVYQIGVWFEDRTKYIESQNWRQKEFTVSDGDELTKTLTVQKVSGTVRVTVTDNNDNPIEHAWVWCGNWRELEGQVKGDFDQGRVIESGSDTGMDGVGVIGLVSGHEYECGAGSPPELGLISPQMQTVMLTKKSPDAELTFAFQEADAKIEGKVSFADNANKTVDDIRNLWCNAWAEEGGNSWDDSRDDEFSLNAIEGTWHIWCGTDIVNDDGTRSWYHSEDQENGIEIKSGDTKTKNLVLSESIFDVPNSASETFDSASPKTITLGDGTSLDIPAGALATSGNVTVTAEPSMDFVETSKDEPFGFPWNFEAFDSSNVLISGNFNTNVTLSIPYDEEKLAEMGIDESTILPKYYDEDSGSWKDVTNASQDTDANVIRFQLEHFSKVGLISNKRQPASLGVPSRPRALSTANITKKSVVLKWRAPKSGTIKRYKVQVRKFKVAKKKQWQSYTVKGKRQRKVSGLPAGTRFQFRVQACNASGCGKYSAWQAYKTKK